MTMSIGPCGGRAGAVDHRDAANDEAIERSFALAGAAVGRIALTGRVALGVNRLLFRIWWRRRLRGKHCAGANGETEDNE